MYNRSNYGVSPRAFGGLLEDVLQNGFQRVFSDDNWNDGPNVPVNIQENDNAFELQLIAPGLKKEDFKISVDKNVLHISYEHKKENKEETSKWIRKEYKSRTFRRSFTLTEKVNVAGINAKYNDGILHLTLPKKENTEPATQEITVA